MRKCNSCSKRRARARTAVNNTSALAVAQTQTIQSQDTPSFTHNEFRNMFYIGESGEVKSVLAQLSYGYRDTGQQMFVHNEDLKVNPHLWTSEYVQKDDFTTITGVGEKTAQKLYDDGITTFKQLKQLNKDEISKYTNVDILSKVT